MYGAAITHFILFFMWPLVATGNSRLPDGQITIDAAMFFIASMLMIAEAWNSYKSKVSGGLEMKAAMPFADRIG